MIELYQFPTGRKKTIPNPSPFCVKVETFLRVNKIPYKIVHHANPRKTPKGKLPFIVDTETKAIVPDSELIFDYFKNQKNIDIDKDLSDQERAICWAFKKMLEDHLYWTAMYARWVGEGWSHVKKQFFRGLPPLLKSIVPYMVQKDMKRSLKGQGIGRHSEEEIYKFGGQSVQALADFLGEKKYFFGEKISSLDIVAYAFLCNAFDSDFTPTIKSLAEKHENLKRFTQMMGKTYFPELSEKKTDQ